MDPITSSLYWNVPIPVIIGGLEIVAEEVPEVYPIPASEINTLSTTLSVVTESLPIAVPTPEVGVAKVIVGADGYPLPPEIIETNPIPEDEVTNIAVAAAPTPYVVYPTPVIV